MDLIGKIGGLGVTYLFVKIRYVFEIVQGHCTVSTKALYC